MPTHISRRSVLGATLAGVAGLAGCLTTTDVGYEIWALDQGADSIYVYEAFSEPNEDTVEFDQTSSIALSDEQGIQADGPFTPHTIRFTEEYGYAAITCLDAGLTLLYRADDKQLLASIDTGAGSHFASFTPGDTALIVDVIDESKIVRVDVDFTEREFSIGSELVLHEAVESLSDDDGSPLYHTHRPDGQSIHSLGPNFENRGVVTLDHEEFEIENTLTGEELPANGVTHPNPSAASVYLATGRPTNQDTEREDGVGEYLVYDTEAEELLRQAQTGGIDPGGIWSSPDGSEAWIVNRETNDGVVLDTETNEVVDDLPAIGPADGETVPERDAPENVWFSPDGRFVFTTLRGPVPPASAPHPTQGVTPGVAVLDAESKERTEVLEPDPISEYEDSTIEDARANREGDATQIPDFHGLGVRPLSNFDGKNAPPY